jgi:hypothetical protein
MTNDEELSDNSQSDEEDEDDEDVDLDEEAELRRLEELDKIASDNALKEQKRLEREAMKLVSVHFINYFCVFYYAHFIIRCLKWMQQLP